MLLEKFDKNIWIKKIPLNFYFIPYGTRMTIIKLENNNLFVHSPIKIDNKMKKQIDSLRKVKYIISPNTLHHLFMEDFKKNASRFKTLCIFKT